MLLPHLTQLVQLDRGQAWPVYYYLHAEQRSLLHRDPAAGQRLTTTEALSLAPLAKLLARLDRLVACDRLAPPAKPRPHRLKLPYAEMATLRFLYPRLLASAACTPDSQAVLAAALGRFHQPSLNLEHHIRLHPASGPGCQLALDVS